MALEKTFQNPTRPETKVVADGGYLIAVTEAATGQARASRAAYSMMAEHQRVSPQFQRVCVCLLVRDDANSAGR